MRSLRILMAIGGLLMKMRICNSFIQRFHKQ